MKTDRRGFLGLFGGGTVAALFPRAGRQTAVLSVSEAVDHGVTARASAAMRAGGFLVPQDFVDIIELTLPLRRRDLTHTD